MNAEIIGIAEAPGKDEDAKGRPFVGRTGREMNELYLPMAGLRRDDIYFTNTVKCWPRNDRDLSDSIISSCSTYHLSKEFRQLYNKRIVILMGATACSLAGLNVEMHHGRPRTVEMFGERVLVWPMYHPAAGMHDYALMSILMEDWMALGEFMRTGHMDEPKDEFPNPMYLRLTEPDEVFSTFEDEDADDPIAIDTEYDPLPVGVRPYCLTYTISPGTGFLIKAEDGEAVRAFASCLGVSRNPTALPGRLDRRLRSGFRRRRRVLMHNALADLPPLDTMGVHIDARDVRDTMVLSYHLNTTPQALKVLAYRLCGMEMVEFDDLVTPYAVAHWLAYMEILSTVTWPKPEPYMRLVPEKEYVDNNGQQVAVGTHMVEKLYKPQGLTTKVKRLLTDYRKDPGPKVFKRWWDWDEQEKQPAIAEFGDMPKKSITMVTNEHDLLQYACRDSDATKRSESQLRLLRRTFRRKYGV